MHDMPPFVMSEKARVTLATPEAESFRRVMSDHATNVFDYFTELSELQEEARLDIHAVMTAIDSAYLDIIRDQDFHQYENGPSPQRVGAALATWFNRLRPIHFKVTPIAPTDTVNLANPRCAVFFGLLACYHQRNPNPNSPPTLTLTDWFRENADIYDDIVYTMQWRAPDYRQLSLIFSLARLGDLG